MKRHIYNALFGFFALVFPLLVFNVKYPFRVAVTQASSVVRDYTWTFASMIAIFVTILFLRKRFVEWVSSFDRVSYLKGIAIWIRFFIPSGIWFGAVYVANYLGPNAVHILGWTFVSHMIAGLFRALALKEKAENFKAWVLK